MRALLFITLLAACGAGARATFASPCEEATHLVATCGATVPFLNGRACTGLARYAAISITQHATDCDGLATLAGRLEECMPDAGDGPFPTAEALQFPVAHTDPGAGATP